jgi:hypothetical protein
MPGQKRQEELPTSEKAEEAARAEWERLAEASALRLSGRDLAAQLEEPMRRMLGDFAGAAPADFTDALQKLREQFSGHGLPPLEDSQVPQPEE